MSPIIHAAALSLHVVSFHVEPDSSILQFMNCGSAFPISLLSTFFVNTRNVFNRMTSSSPEVCSLDRTLIIHKHVHTGKEDGYNQSA